MFAAAGTVAVGIVVFVSIDPGGASAAESLQKAALATVAQGGAAVTFDVAVSGQSGSKQATGNGTVAFSTGSALFSYSETEGLTGGIELRITPAAVYLRSPQMLASVLAEGQEWIAFPLPARGTPDSTTTTSTTTTSTTTTTTAAGQVADIVRRLTEAGFEVTEGGQFDVNGINTTAYNFVDPDAAGSLTGTAFVDDENLMRRVEIDSIDGAGKTGDLNMDLNTFTAPPDVPAPPAESTVDISDVLSNAFGK